MNENTEMQNQIPEILDENTQEETGEAPLDCAPPTDDSADVGDRDGASVDQNDGLLASVAEDQNSDLDSPLEDSTLTRMQALEDELASLKKELLARKAETARVESEFDELLSLYPNASLSEIPDSVWDDVRRGIPIAAAYAVAERRAFLVREKAKQCNLENKSRSSGAVSGTSNDYYTPGEVRMMSAEEVRSNYSKIINSMKKWH